MLQGLLSANSFLAGEEERVLAYQWEQMWVGGAVPSILNSYLASAAAVQELIKSLAKAGYQMVIITNGHHIIQRQKVESCDVRSPRSMAYY